MEGQFLIGPGDIADQPWRFRNNGEAVSWDAGRWECVRQACVSLLKRRLYRSIRKALADRKREVADAPRAQRELQPRVRIDLAVLGALRLMTQGKLDVRPVEGLACDKLIRARGLNRVGGCGAVEGRSCP